MPWWIILLFGLGGGGLISWSLTALYHQKGKKNDKTQMQELKGYIEKKIRPILIAQGLTEDKATSTSTLIADAFSSSMVKMVGTTTTEKIILLNKEEGETPETGSNIRSDPFQSQPGSEEEPPEDK